MPSVSPIAQYLRINKAIPKRDKNGCHFFSPEGLYLGRLTKNVLNNYEIFSLETYGEGFKKMYTKHIAIGQQFAYIKNTSAPLGVSVLPIKKYMRKVFVDFIEKTNKLEDTEQTLTNKLDLIAIDERTGVGLYDTDRPFEYTTTVTNSKNTKLKHPRFNHTIH